LLNKKERGFCNIFVVFDGLVVYSGVDNILVATLSPIVRVGFGVIIPASISSRTLRIGERNFCAVSSFFGFFGLLLY